MSDGERLTKVLENHNIRYPLNRQLADVILEAGVVFPKFKVGQEVWHLVVDRNNNFYAESGYHYVAENKDKIVLCYPKEKGWRSKKIIRKDWVFATEAEALAALGGNMQTHDERLTNPPKSYQFVEVNKKGAE